MTHQLKKKKSPGIYSAMSKSFFNVCLVLFHPFFMTNFLFILTVSFKFTHFPLPLSEQHTHTCLPVLDWGGNL